MLRKFILVPAVLALAGWLTSGTPVFAQHTHTRGPTHVSTAHVNVNHSNFHGSVHYGNAWRGGYYNRGYYNHYRPYAGWYAPYYSWYNPYSYGYSYPYTDYSYATPSYSYYNPMSAYATPNYTGTALTANTATVEVIVPDPQARVWFDDTLTTQTGTDRVFTTAALYQSGTYRIRAAWTENGRTVTADRMVTVAPNERAVVDFTRPAAY